MTSYEDYELDERAENNDETLSDLDEERKWKIISNFKEFISKEAEFANIYKLSSQKILEIIETTTSNENKSDLPEWHLDFIAEVAEEVTKNPLDLNYIKNIYVNIYNAININ